eukprot:478128-Rhodomonas_salina.2
MAAKPPFMVPALPFMASSGPFEVLSLPFMVTTRAKTADIDRGKGVWEPEPRQGQDPAPQIPPEVRVHAGRP